MSDSPAKLGLLKAGCNKRTQNLVFKLPFKNLFPQQTITSISITYHINPTGLSCWQAQAAQFIPPYAEDIEQQSSYQGKKHNGSNDSASDHSSCTKRDTEVLLWMLNTFLNWVQTSTCVFWFGSVWLYLGKVNAFQKNVCDGGKVEGNTKVSRIHLMVTKNVWMKFNSNMSTIISHARRVMKWCQRETNYIWHFVTLTVATWIWRISGKNWISTIICYIIWKRVLHREAVNLLWNEQMQSSSVYQLK